MRDEIIQAIIKRYYGLKTGIGIDPNFYSSLLNSKSLRYILQLQNVSFVTVMRNLNYFYYYSQKEGI